MGLKFLQSVSGAFLVFYLGLASGLAQTEELPKPTGEPILTISGNISVTNVGNTAQFDLEMLESMEMNSFQTTTPWYDEAVTFEGVALTTLMERVGAEGETIDAVALNDYTVEIPMDDFEKFGTLLALKRDGDYMPIRDKGPLFIVYPYDNEEELQSETYYSRSAWQVSKLIVE